MLITKYFHPAGGIAAAAIEKDKKKMAAATPFSLSLSLSSLSSSSLTPGQLAAATEIMDFLKNPKRAKEHFFLLTGSAGTGKTFLISYIYSQLKKDQLSVAFTASTNKAVNVLQATYVAAVAAAAAAADAAVTKEKEEKEEVEEDKEKKDEEEEEDTLTFNTIHRFMCSQRAIDRNGETYFEFNAAAGKKKGGKAGGKTDVVFVDEVSMIPNVLAQQIAQMHKKTYPKIVLIGDKAQLPPVDEPQSDIFTWNISTCHLSEIVRYRNNIVMLADQVKQLICHQTRTKLAACRGNGVVLYRDDMSGWLEAYFGRPNVVVLAYTNERVRYYNDYIRKKVIVPAATAATAVAHKKVMVMVPAARFAPNEIIMFNNFYQAYAPQRGKDDPLSSIKYYTSYQVRVVSCEPDTFVIDYAIILETLQQPAADKLRRVLPNHIPIYNIVTEGGYVVKNPHDYAKVQEALELVKSTFLEAKETFSLCEETVCVFWDFYYKELRDVFADVTYGYAMTVHKSQGSTYQCVFIDMKDIIQRNPKPQESYQCLYTAITRASQEVHVYY